ncbi:MULTISPECIES: DUF1996 domain-containing protein [unclassified Streptomyces]|uniref:DUF1996 domain-containing protein n=1 Tax=Streptomyces sp. NBC_00060 TaxID=2975636 RepID=A0AAU2HBQ8_9ACTN
MRRGRRYRNRNRSQRGKLIPFLAVVALAGTAAVAAVSNYTGGSPGLVASASTVQCPDLTDSLSQVSDADKQMVDESVALLDVQVSGAYDRLQQTPVAKRDALVNDLWVQRMPILTRISGALARSSSAPMDPRQMASCKVVTASSEADSIVSLRGRGKGKGKGKAKDNGNGNGNENGGGDGGADEDNVGQGQGLSRKDFADITQVRPNAGGKGNGKNASGGGQFTSKCGRNENGHSNPDNVIVAPGVSNGAHHMHDYVGNLDTSAFSTNDSLSGAGTTCSNGDKSAYYWPVLRLLDGSRERDAKAPGGGQDKNVGKILQPADVKLTMDGNAVDNVTEMPPFMRVITGDAKAFTDGVKNANASWSCTGFEDRQLKDKYPICPQGSRVVRNLEFPSCWDGKNADSANHRTHVVFPKGDGSCPKQFVAVPKLTMVLAYDVPKNAFFAIDSFPEQVHKPVTDHGDFINVMPQKLMRRAVNCINSGRQCEN